MGALPGPAGAWNLDLAELSGANVCRCVTQARVRQSSQGRGGRGEVTELALSTLAGTAVGTRAAQPSGQTLTTRFTGTQGRGRAFRGSQAATPV